MSQQDLFGTSASGIGAAPMFGFAHTAMSQAFTAFGSASKAFEPAIKSMARCNIEMLSLMNRRTQAYLELPAQLAQCKGPQDMVDAQMRFWQSAADDIADGRRRIAAALGQAQPHAADLIARPRDYITFPEPSEAARRETAVTEREPTVRDNTPARRSAAA